MQIIEYLSTTPRFSAPGAEIAVPIPEHDKECHTVFATSSSAGIYTRMAMHLDTREVSLERIHPIPFLHRPFLPPSPFQGMKQRTPSPNNLSQWERGVLSDV